MAEAEKKPQGGKCKKSKTGARKAMTAKAGRRRPSHIVATVNAYGERIYQQTQHGEPAQLDKATTPQARKRARWLSTMDGTGTPSYPRLEAVKNPKTGAWEQRELPPQKVATRREYYADPRPWLRDRYCQDRLSDGSRAY